LRAIIIIVQRRMGKLTDGTAPKPLIGGRPLFVFRGSGVYVAEKVAVNHGVMLFVGRVKLLGALKRKFGQAWHKKWP
jgi:hypothetical protein